MMPDLPRSLPSLRHYLSKVAVLIGALTATGCALKDSDFFSMAGGATGTIELAVIGAPDGATVRVTGGLIDETRTVGSTVSAIPALPMGSYTVAITPPVGYTCQPISMQLVLSEAEPLRRASFECQPEPGSLAVGIAGLGQGAMLDFSLTGPTSKTGSIGVGGMTFGGLLPGAYQWMYPAPEGHDCQPTDGEFVIEPGEAESVDISCAATDGGIAVTVTGATATVSFSGPETGGGEVGGSPVTFGELTPGTYTVTVSAPAGFTCLPTDQQVAVAQGTVTPVVFECVPLTGSITATVTGATAEVSYSGAASGGGAVGATPVVFSGLPAGGYNVAVEAPTGFICEPESVALTLDPGENESVEFDCEEEPAEEVVEYDIDLAGLASPGAVAAGIYQRALLDAALVAVATINLRAFGGSTFYGTSPDRIGFGGASGWELDAVFPVAALVFRIQVLRLCALNAALSAGNFVSIGYYNAALVLLATSQITATGCFVYPTPDGTRYIRLTGPAVGFADINGFRLGGVLVSPP